MASADKLIAVFTEAKARTAGPERDRFVAEACGDDAELKEQIVSLLEADSEEGRADFLKNSIAVPAARVTENTGGRIGQYKLLQQLGEGGCGVVYMAEQHEPMRRRVALKIIKLGMDTKQIVARFEAERQALALMDHPNIAKVFDAGATDTGRPFFVMELVRGIKITDYCDQNNLSTTERLELFLQVCQAVQHAHQKGVIHRDLKPSNILVAQHDSVAVPKVIDFGIAKATAGQQLTDRTVFTAFEQFIGTPAYMSPEQAQLSGLDIDTRTDIYALGVLLYELITGRTPFDQKELLAAGLDEMRRTIREREPPIPSTCLSTLMAAELTTAASHRQTEPPKLIHLVRGDLDWIVMKALEKDRIRRYETANGLAMDVQRHLKNEPVNARPPSNLYRLQKLVQRNRLVFAAAGAVTVATLLALVILVASNLRITRESKARVAALNAAQTSEQRARGELFLSLKSQAQARRYSRQMGQRLESLAALAEAARLRGDAGLRDEAIAAMALPDVRLGPKWEAWETNSKAIAFDASYQRYARVDNQGVISIRSVPEDRELQRLHSNPPATPGRAWRTLSFSPDGRFLASLDEENRPRVWNLEEAQSVLTDDPEGCSAVAFSPDSRQLAIAQKDFILCFDLATGRERTRWQTSENISALSFGPDNRKVAVGYFGGTNVSVYDATDGRQLVQLAVGRTGESVCWHPDGKRLAVGGNDPRIQIWDIEAKRKVKILEGHVQEVNFLTFHPGGELLASGSWDGVLRLWDPAGGRQAMQIPLGGNLQFSKDGRWLGTFRGSDGKVQLLEVIQSQEYHTLESSFEAGKDGYFSCAVSPDNQLLAVAMRDGVRLWDLPARREVALLPSASAQSVVFEPDGKGLFVCSLVSSGLKRWPIHRSGTANELRLGPPRSIQLPFVPHRISQIRDGGTMAIVSEASGKAAVLDLATESIRSGPVPHPQAAFVALSPDASWLATSGWHSELVRLWNAQTSELIHELVIDQHASVSFTPDGRELIIARNGEFSFLDVRALEIRRGLRRDIGLYPGDVAFSPVDKLMAMEMAPGVIHLKEVSSGRTVAKLEDPYADRSTSLTFTPDGTKLVAVANYAAAIHTWDLRAIRIRLKTMGLDWNWPEFPPQNPEQVRMSRGKPGLKIRVISDDAH